MHMVRVSVHHTFGENFVHNMRLCLIPLKSLRMNGNNVGFWVEVFFIPRLNALAPPTSALFQFFLSRIPISACNVKLNVGFTNFVIFIISEYNLGLNLAIFFSLHKICL